MSLRLKLLLAASLLLVVPVAGYRFVLAMEAYLRANQVEGAAESARLIASALESRPGVLPGASGIDDPGPHLHVRPAPSPPEVDGYDGDWGPMPGGAPPEVPLLRAATHGESLYLLLILRPVDATRDAGGVRLVLEDSPSLRRAWLLDARGTGRITAMEVPPAAGSTWPAHPDPRIGVAIGGAGGKRIYELRVPLALLAPRLRFEILAAHAGDAVPSTGSYRLVLPPPGLHALLERVAAGEGRRTRVTDGAGRVLVEVGTLVPRPGDAGWSRILEMLLDADEDALLSLAPTTRTLSGPEVAGALGGAPSARLRRASAGGGLVVSAAHPLYRDARLVGALVLEESTSRIQALGRRALLELLLTAGVAFLAGTVVLLAVAGHAAARLRDLRDRAARAVDDTGRVHRPFRATAGGDEIGDLGRSFEATVTRLQGYQDYLEQLARRLSHELRTPLAVIRSSLDALSMAPEAGSGDGTFLERARHGVDRLDRLIRRMSEASRLEQALSGTPRERFDLPALLDGAVAAQAQARPEHALELVADAPAVMVNGSPELLLQALDKLLDNARDFASGKGPIRVQTGRRGPMAYLEVINQGPLLPAGAPGRLFDSMVSQREASGSDQPHLGLGLYVVRLVAEFHGGRAFAGNLSDASGVRVGMEIPVDPGGA